MPISCPQCGAQNADSAMSCYACGSAINPYGQSGGYAQPPVPYGQPQVPQQNPYGQPQYPQQSPYGQPLDPYGAPVYSQPGAGYGGYGGASRAFADPLKRFLAFLIDNFVVFGGLLPGYILIFAGSAADSGALSALGGLLAFVGGVGVGMYNLYLLGSRGSSIGKKMMGLLCVGPDGQPLGFGKAFVRELLKGVLFNVCILLALWFLFDKDKQQLYDKVFNSNVYLG